MAKRSIAEFCGVGIHTAIRWLYHGNKGNLPGGETSIKLMCFLELNGYKVIEFESIPQKCRNFAKLIGYGLITSDQAAEMLGYTKVHSLYQLLRGEIAGTADKDQKLWDLWKARRDELDELVEEAAKSFKLNLSPSPSSEYEEDISSTQVSRGCPQDGVVDIMQGLLKLLDNGTLQKLNDVEWAALRAHSDVILRLSSHLSTISAKLMKLA